MENGKDMDVDETRTPKKQRKIAVTKAQSREVPRRQLIEDEEVHIGDMSQYMKTSSWEDLVLTVDTIEREPGDNLTVYFTLSVLVLYTLARILLTFEPTEKLANASKKAREFVPNVFRRRCAILDRYESALNPIHS